MTYLSYIGVILGVFLWMILMDKLGRYDDHA